MKKKIIELKNVELTYNKGKDNAFKALHGINLNVREGDFVVIFGPSGCGKSSLLNVIAGLENPDQGEVLIDQANIVNMKEKERIFYHRKKVGMVFQAYNLIPTLNVLDNVALPQNFINVDKREREKKALHILNRFGIEGQAKKIPTELSGGQQQRIGIARAIINDPQIILADEPIGNLDSESAGNVMRILGELNQKEGKTVVMVSHNPENIIWGSHVVYMKDGKIIKEEFKDPSREDATKEAIYSKQNNDLVGRIEERFKGLSMEQINLLINPLRAKIITEFLFIPFEEETAKKIETIIRERLEFKIDRKKMLEKLDQFYEGEGAEIDYRLAQKITSQLDQVENLVNKYSAADNLTERAIALADFVLQGERTWSDEQKKRFIDLLKRKLTNQIKHQEMLKFLDYPENRGGIGLDRRLAKQLARRIDLAMVLVYGKGK